MKRFVGIATLALSLGLAATPAFARTSYVLDNASMFSPETVSSLNSRIASFNAQTGKEVVVETVPSLQGQRLYTAAGAAFSQLQVDGVLIYIAKDDRQDMLVPDRAGVASGAFNADTMDSIRTAMEDSFRAGSFDSGITNAVTSIIQVYQYRANSVPAGGNANAPALSPNRVRTTSSSGVHLTMFWWIVIALVGYFIIRSLLRSMSGPRYYGGGMPPGGAPGPGYGGGYGYGPGYGGGGSFWSGLLGGLGGAWLGNEMFRGGGGGGAADSGGSWGGGAPSDPGAFASDAGQADMGGASGGDFSGGGFGGGDFGGGGGDFGGSGGGW
ncbi:MAG: TPM domain-containing protein [Candidatus Eremiobacteraeota bacterium]|nr:TPM domain-containing protein [Candidatus Eremiobacteraeota bacterium]